MNMHEIARIYKDFSTHDNQQHNEPNQRLERFADYLSEQRAAFETMAQIVAKRLGGTIDPAQCLDDEAAARIEHSIAYYFKLNKAAPAPNSKRKER